MALHNFLCNSNLSSFNLLKLLHNKNLSFHPLHHLAPPRPPFLPQPNPNPNNKPFHPAYVANIIGYPTYHISHIEFNEIHLQPDQVLNQWIPRIITEHIEDEEIQPLEINAPLHNFVDNLIHNSVFFL